MWLRTLFDNELHTTVGLSQNYGVPSSMLPSHKKGEKFTRKYLLKSWLIETLLGAELLHLVRSYTAVCVCLSVCACTCVCVCVCVVIWPRSEWQTGIPESCIAQWVRSASKTGQTDFPSTLMISLSEIMAVGSVMCELIQYLCSITIFMAGLPASSQYPEGPALTGHLSTGFSWFPCV
jgi:hypothetical protein